MKHFQFLFLLITPVFFTALPAQTSDKYLKQLPQPESTLFFIKPISYKVNGSPTTFIPDFTFTYFPETPASTVVTINFTIQGKEPVESVESLVLAGGFETNPSFLFLEQKKGKWINRFTAEIPLEALFSLLKEEGGQFAIIRTGPHRLTVPYQKNWRKASEAIGPVLRSKIKQ